MCSKSQQTFVLVMPTSSPTGRGFRWTFQPQEDGTVIVSRHWREMSGPKTQASIVSVLDARQTYKLLLGAGWEKF